MEMCISIPFSIMLQRPHGDPAILVEDLLRRMAIRYSQVIVLLHYKNLAKSYDHAYGVRHL